MGWQKKPLQSVLNKEVKDDVKEMSTNSVFQAEETTHVLFFCMPQCPAAGQAGLGVTGEAIVARGSFGLCLAGLCFTGFPWWLRKHLPTMQETQVRSCWEDP